MSGYDLLLLPYDYLFNNEFLTNLEVAKDNMFLIVDEAHNLNKHI